MSPCKFFEDFYWPLKYHLINWLETRFKTFLLSEVIFLGTPQGPLRVNEGQVSTSGPLISPQDYFYAEFMYMGLKKNIFGA